MRGSFCMGERGEGRGVSSLQNTLAPSQRAQRTQRMLDTLASTYLNVNLHRQRQQAGRRIEFCVIDPFLCLPSLTREAPSPFEPLFRSRSEGIPTATPTAIRHPSSRARHPQRQQRKSCARPKRRRREGGGGGRARERHSAPPFFPLSSCPQQTHTHGRRKKEAPSGAAAVGPQARSCSL